MPLPGDSACGLSGDDVSAFQLWVVDRLKRDPLVQVHGLSSLSCYAGVSFALFVKQFKLAAAAEGARGVPARLLRAPLRRHRHLQRAALHPRSLRRGQGAAAGGGDAVTRRVRMCNNAPPGAAAADMMPLQYVPRAFGGGLQDDGTAHVQAWCERQLELQAVGL